MIWKRNFTLESLNQNRIQSMVGHLGIQFIDSGDDWLKASMPVDKRTTQPYGILHGGASVSLAETVGSVASLLCLPADSNTIPVGIEINANHVKSVRKGNVYAKANPIKIGRKLHIWNITITNEDNNTICVSRLTTMIINR